MKELAIIFNIVGSVYFMGGMLVQHDKAKGLIAGMSISFKGLLLELKEKKPTETIHMLLKLFLAIAGSAFVGILLMGILKVHSPQLVVVLSVTFAVSGMLSGSLFWVLRHKVVLKQVSQWLLFFGGGSLLLPIIDVLTNAGITNVVYSVMKIGFTPFLHLPDSKGLIYEASVVTGFYAGFIILFYFIAWLYAVPIALVAWAIVAIPILGARTINRAFPKEPIAAVFFSLWLFSVFYLAYASSP